MLFQGKLEEGRDILSGTTLARRKLKIYNPTSKMVISIPRFPLRQSLHLMIKATKHFLNKGPPVPLP